MKSKETTVQFELFKDSVLIYFNRLYATELQWDAALQLVKVLRLQCLRAASGLLNIPGETEGDFTILVAAPYIGFYYKDHLISDPHYSQIRKFANQLRQCAKRAEEYAKSHEIISDQALFIRAGFPFALSDRRDIQHEAQKESLYDTTLRRHIPVMKAGTGFKVFMPGVKQHHQGDQNNA